jgi:hypothetical protein
MLECAVGKLSSHYRKHAAIYIFPQRSIPIPKVSLERRIDAVELSRLTGWHLLADTQIRFYDRYAFLV